MTGVEVIEDAYLAKHVEVCALIAERMGRIVLEPELYFAPDDRDRKLTGQIWKARREFLKFEAQYLSARGEYLMLGCRVGEHKLCKREVTRDGARLVCNCECHKTGGKNK